MPMIQNILMQRLLAARTEASLKESIATVIVGTRQQYQPPPRVNILQAKRQEALAMTAPARAALAPTPIGAAYQPYQDVLERLGTKPITNGVITFAPRQPTEPELVGQFVPVLERLGMPVEDQTIAGIEAAIGKRYEAPIGEFVPYIGGMDVKFPEFPDIVGGMKDTIIIAAVALGGLFLLSKFIGKR